MHDQIQNPDREMQLENALAELNAQMERHDAETYHRGFTIAELKAAFSIVQPPNWKDPIRAAVSAENAALFKTAIEFMVGGPTRITYRRDGEAVLTNAGYYHNIGA